MKLQADNSRMQNSAWVFQTRLEQPSNLVACEVCVESDFVVYHNSTNNALKKIPLLEPL